MAGKMSSLEFACSTANLRLNPDVLHAVRRVLVDGEPQTVVSADLGVHKQTIYYWVTRVTDAYSKICRAMSKEAPAGWSTAIMALPDGQMQAVKAQMDVAVATLRAQRVNDGQS